MINDFRKRVLVGAIGVECAILMGCGAQNLIGNNGQTVVLKNPAEPSSGAGSSLDIESGVDSGSEDVSNNASTSATVLSESEKDGNEKSVADGSTEGVSSENANEDASSEAANEGTSSEKATEEMSSDDMNEISDTDNKNESTDSDTGNSKSGTDAELSPVPTRCADGTLFGNVITEDAVVVGDDFWYESLSQEVIDYITGRSYPAEGTDLLQYSDLKYVHVMHVDLDGVVHGGEIICNAAIAQDIAEIFMGLYQAGYPIERVQLVDEYEQDDDLSVQANNTSCFNYRLSTGSKSKLSMHGYGLAIDINPLYNPYVKNGHVEVWGAPYVDRTASFPYKIDDNDLCVTLFKQHGFTWGGDWKTLKDYQHFEKKV